VGQTLRKLAVARWNLADQRPDLAAEWHPTLNTLSPQDVAAGTKIPAWWVCPVGHEPYQTLVATRGNGSGCPACGNIRRLSHLVRYEGPKPGRSLADRRPDLAAEWDHDANELTPFQVALYSHVEAHWRCPSGHTYTRSIHSRVAMAECPGCKAARRR
jgi:hypothetical protein